MKTLVLYLFLLNGLAPGSIPGDHVVEYKTGPKFRFVHRVEMFVEKTGDRCKEYSGADWLVAQRSFGVLIGEYSDFYSSLDKKEKDRVNKAIGQYVGFTMKAGIKISFEVLREIYRHAPSVLEGIYEGTGLKELLE